MRLIFNPSSSYDPYARLELPPLEMPAIGGSSPSVGITKGGNSNGRKEYNLI